MTDKPEIRPLVLGAGGLVGRRLAAYLEQVFPHTASASRVEIDITDRWRFESELERLRPTVVINTAAVSDVDLCEREPALAERVNAQAPTDIAKACSAAGVRMLQLSTDYVFDGAKDGEYDEADAPNPLSSYGRSKLLGEMGVLENLVEAIVLRVSFVFGPGRRTFFDSMVEQAVASREPVPVIESWTSRPTYTEEICRGVESLLKSGETGVWHFACPPAMNRADFARRLFELIGESADRVVPLTPHALELPASRPAASALSTRRFEARFGRAVRGWTDCAREYLSLADQTGPGRDGTA